MRGVQVTTIGALEAYGIGELDPGVADPSRGQLSGWPKPAVPTRAAWNYDGTYIAQPGDTFSGIARTYLGQYTQFRDIWNAQPKSFRADPQRVAKAARDKRYPVDILFVGDVLVMPAKAQLEARRLGVLVDPPVGVVPPPVVLPPGEDPAQVMPEMVITEKRRGKNPILALASAVAGGILFLHKHPFFR